MPLHICPACSKQHFVNEVCHKFAYGRQLTCSPHCKLVWRHRVLNAMCDTRDATQRVAWRVTKEAV